MVSVMVSGCSLFGVRSGTEQAAYDVVDALGPQAEVRRYPAQVVAETTAAEAGDRNARNAAFRRLFDYISGANVAQARVAMTTPVETRSESVAMTTPVETARGPDEGLLMRFRLPAGYAAETAPRPTDPRVRVAVVPSRLVVVLRFSGSTGAEAVAARTAQLRAIVERSRWQAAGEPVAMFYDPPWTLPFLRRNEVALPVADR